MKKLKVIEVRSELGAGTRGAGMGVDAIRVACLNKNADYFGKYEYQAIPHKNHLLFEPTPYKYAKRIDGIFQNLSLICSAVSDSISVGDYFPLVLSGDHSSAYGTIAGIKKSFPDKRLGIIWIDAHADLHSPYTTPSGNMHGMPLAMALGEDHQHITQQKLEGETLRYWNEIKNLGTQGAKILPQDIVYVAVRSTEYAEEQFMAKHNIKNFTTKEVNERGLAYITDKIFDSLKACDIIYISFDVDSTDSRFSVGTGTPVVKGLSPEQNLALNAMLVQNPKVVCWEMAEVNPTLDSTNKMANFAFEVLEKVTESLNMRFSG